jgi:hypothetical protein
MMPLMILSIISGSVFTYNLITGIFSIVFVLIFFVFNVAQIGKKMAILKMAYVLPVIVGGVILYTGK